MNSKALMPLTHPVTSHSAAPSAYWIRTIAKHTGVTVRESSPILSPWYLRGQSAYPLAQGVGSVGRLAGAASSTRLGTH
jgi:hypothetical protein